LRLVSFNDGKKSRLGTVIDEKVYDLRKGYCEFLKNKGNNLAEKIAKVRIPDNTVKLIKGGDKAYQALKEGSDFIEKNPNYFNGVDLEKLELEAPIMPKIIICGGANFDDHLEETKRSKPTEVEFFLKAPNCVIGPKKAVKYESRVTEKYDYEVELGIVIKKEGRFIPEEEAFDYIFGYTIVNDISARSRQVIPWGESNFQLRFGEGKNYDTGCPLGPWIVTTDELSDVSSLDLKTWVSGELRQNNNTKNLIWNVPKLVSYYSQFMTLQPGFVIASGTPGGPALGSDTELGADPYERDDGVKRGAYMKSGDQMKLHIDGIGELENPIK